MAKEKEDKKKKPIWENVTDNYKPLLKIARQN